MAENQGLNVEIGITLDRLAKQLAAAEARMVKAAKRSEDSFTKSNKRAADSFRQVDQAAERTGNRLGRISNQTKGQIQNLGFQIQDFAVQVGSGTSATQALAQQLPQLAGGFGPVGAAIGVLAAVGIPLLSAAFGGLSGEVETLQDRLEALDKAVKEFQAAADAARAPVDELRADYGALADEAARALAQLAADKQRAALDEINAKAKALAITFGELQDVVSADEGGQFGTNEAFFTLTQDLGLTEEAAQRVIDALRALEKAEGPQAVAQAAQNARAALEAAGITAEQELGSALSTLVERSAAFNGTVEKTPGILSTMVGWLDQAAAAADRLGASADGLVGKLAAAATEAFNVAWNMANAERLAQNDQLAAQYEQYGQGRVIGERIARESGDLYGNNPVLPEPPARRGGEGGGTSAADREAQALERLMETGARRVSQLQHEIDLIGKTAEETAFLTAQYEMLQQAKQAGLDLDRVNIETGKTLRQEIDEQAAAVARLTVQYDQAKQQADFFNGVTEDLQDGLIDAIVAGEDFRGVMASIAQEIARAALQAALFGRGPLAGLFGGVPTGGLFGALGFASGGYTGTGGKYEPAGVVHKGEYVFSADAVRRIGVSNLEAMHRQLKGYAGGGSVGAPAVSVAPAAPTVNVAIIDDESRFGEYLAQDPRAERAILQVVRRNGIGRAQ